mgnify:CR=1 FL=1
MPKLWYTAPAYTWNEALPLGNGRMGAMCFGGTLMDAFCAALWSGGFTDRINPDAAQMYGEHTSLMGMYGGDYREHSISCWYSRAVFYG